jgi:hypothetical protein
LRPVGPRDRARRGKEETMKFGIFYELQLPRPWDEGGELRLYQNALDQVELADRLGYDYAGRSSIIFSKSIRIHRLPRCFSAPRASAPGRSVSPTALCS